MRIWFALAFSMQAAWAMSSAASTINFSEIASATGGDFRDGLSIDNENIGTVSMAGVSLINGRLDGACTDGGTLCNSLSLGDTGDSFALTIAPGYQLIGGAVGAGGEGPEGLEISFNLYSRVGPFAFDLVPGDVVPSFTLGRLGFAPLGPGTYHISVIGSGADADGDYLLEWGVALETRGIPLVPLPASLPMLVAGLGVLGLLRKRKSLPRGT